MNNLKTLWNQFDPLGVYSPGCDWPDDEYEMYIHQTMYLLDQGAGFNELFEYVGHTVKDHMEINKDDQEISAFVHSLLGWYRKQN